MYSKFSLEERLKFHDFYMKLTPHQAKYLAYDLTRKHPADSLEKLSASLANAQVDLNPHQVEAALFAFKSPLSKGAILADEVGLGKTIEAGLVISQKWAENRRKILLIVPANLRKQWNQELQDKFFLKSLILEKKSLNEILKSGNLNPFEQSDCVVITSYHFARANAHYVKRVAWDVVVIDEAHRLRNVYKTSSKIAREIKDAVAHAPKILLTATPLQNSLLELYGLVGIIDDHVFGDIDSFKAKYAHLPKEQDLNENELGLLRPRQEMFKELKDRLRPVCIRTLRRQVLEYIKYTSRIPLTQDYIPSEQEVSLYEGVSAFLQRPSLYALPSSQRQLITLILRKLLGSSSFAIASTLDAMSVRLGILIKETKAKLNPDQTDFSALVDDYEALDSESDEWIDSEEGDGDGAEKKSKEYTAEDIPKIEEEKSEIERLRDLAKAIWQNSKGDALLTALTKGFAKAEELGAKRKAVIFTESRITQKYLVELLSKEGYAGKIVLFNGTNTDPDSKKIYDEWLEKHRDSDKVTGSKSADMRQALVERFREDGEILIATEAGAEGINLQFCSIIINYDLPWNPQRIEQRIGRCHRYGQKHDVVVVNFINRKNAADQRIYELLAQKFSLFKGVFGASDEVLGVIESGVDFEKRIAGILQNCRTEDEINTSFDRLQTELDEEIQTRLAETRQQLLENFDAEVHQKLKLNLHQSQEILDSYQRALWEVARYYLNGNAEFSESDYSFRLLKNPFPGRQIDAGPYRMGKDVEDAHVFRPSHPLASEILDSVKVAPVASAELVFNYSDHAPLISSVAALKGKSGTMRASMLSFDSLDSEQHMVLVGQTDDGEDVSPETLKKMLEQVEVSRVKDAEFPTDTLSAKVTATCEVVSAAVAERNSAYFEEEMEKLDGWADDQKRGLEADLKKLETDIKMAKSAAKRLVSLEEKVTAQREIKQMEARRKEQRNRLYEAQDEIERRKEELLDSVERRLKQIVRTEDVFTIRWHVA